MAQLSPENTDPRYEAYQTLKLAGQHSLVWFEDPLYYFGVPTVLFRLYLLVENIPEAADCLVATNRWTEVPVPPNVRSNNALPDEEIRCLQPVPESKTQSMHNIVFLNAKNWNIQLPCNDYPLFPSPPMIVDSLLERILDAPPTQSFFRMRLSTMIGYIYGHVPITQKPSFAQELCAEHQQYHMDILAGVNVEARWVGEHERMIRDAIRAGTYTVKHCSVDRNDRRFFDDGVQ